MSFYSCNNYRNTCGCSGGSGVLGTTSCGCNNCGGILGQQTGNCGCHNHSPFPARNSVCGTCPPGTRPCYPLFNQWWNGCGCNNCGCGGNGCCNNQSNGGSYAFFNSTGSTLTTGSVIPLRYVIGSGELGKGTAGGVVNLDTGIYSVEYNLSASADTAGAIITITPEYLGASHPEYSRSFTVGTAGQTFDIAGSFVANIPSDTTLSLIVTITEPDATTTTTLTGVNASMLIRRISACGTAN